MSPLPLVECVLKKISDSIFNHTCKNVLIEDKSILSKS